MLACFLPVGHMVSVSLPSEEQTPQMVPPAHVRRWPRGPRNELHAAASHGWSTERTIALLSGTTINIDQGDPRGWTPLMIAAGAGFLHVVRILLERRANVSIAGDGGLCALHRSAYNGHLAVTVDLIKVGADPEARGPQGTKPIHQAAAKGHLDVLAVYWSRPAQTWTALPQMGELCCARR